ncbi:MAG: MBL fold metallo-hydrolase, partial [Actinomycetota bacterium]|nr:MBL fold metallo-hydrolase [Actinomycetota bacterium]
RLFAPLPADTIVMPGHGSDTTIGTEQPSLDEWMTRGW